MKNSTSRRPRKKSSPINDFLALSDAGKERVWESVNREIPLRETRPLNASERRLWAKSRKKMGRPIKGKGCKVVSLSVERELLAKADRLAKRKGVTRAAMVAAGLDAVLKEPALLDRPAA